MNISSCSRLPVSFLKNPSRAYRKIRTIKTSPYNLLRHEEMQKVFGLDPDEAKRTLTPIAFTKDNTFDGMNEKVRSLCTLQHFTTDEVVELAVKVIADKCGFTYTETDDTLEIKVIRSIVSLWNFQTMYRMATVSNTGRAKLLASQQLVRRDEQLEELRNTRFENYAALMEALDMKFNFKPELMVPASRKMADVRKVKVEALAHKLMTQQEEKKRTELFNVTKLKHRQAIIAKQQQQIESTTSPQ